MFSLSAKGLEIAHSVCQDRSFSFCIGPKKYYCVPFLADFLSPVVASLHASDPFISEFPIDIVDNENHFENIMSLMRGKPIEITQNNCDTILAVGSILGNNEIVEMASAEVQKSLTKESVISRLNNKHSSHMPVDAEISFIAAHLWEMPCYKLMTIEMNHFRLILQHKDLKIESESWLFDLICKLIEEQGADFKCLFDFISLEYLTETEITKFLSIIDFEHLSSAVWQSICQRLLKSLKTNEIAQQRTTGRIFGFSSSAPLDGIFDNLMKENEGNIVDRGIVKIESSTAAGLSSPQTIVDRNWTSGFFSENVKDSWISFDFGQSTVRLSHYSIKTIRAGKDNVHLRSWVVEGSDDGDVWTIIDERDNCDALNGRDKCSSWKCPESRPFRFVRLRQTAQNHANTFTLALANFELFGTLI